MGLLKSIFSTDVRKDETEDGCQHIFKPTDEASVSDIEDGEFIHETYLSKEGDDFRLKIDFWGSVPGECRKCGEEGRASMPITLTSPLSVVDE